MEILHLSSNTNILICVETWLKPQDRFEIPGFNSVRKDRWGCRGGGIVIYIAKHLKFKTLDNVVNGDLRVESCCIQIYNLTETINIATCYRPPGRKLSGDGWDKFLRAITRLGSTLFLGDVNAHHVEWNCDHTDTNGDTLMDLIDKHQLDILNHNTKTYIDVRNNTSNNLDLALTSTRLTGVSTVYQGEDPMGSDHFPLHIEVYVGKYVYKKTNNRLSSQRTDWVEYKDIMDGHYEYFIQNLVGPRLEKYKLFTDKMTQSIEACTPKKVEVPPGNYRNPVRWWDSECNKFVRLRKAAFKKWQHHPIYDNWISYKKQVAITKKYLRTKKKDSFRQYAASLNHRTNLTHFWNNIKVLKSKWTKTTCKRNEDPEVVKDRINNSIAKICPPWVPVNPVLELQVETNAFPGCSL